MKGPLRSLFPWLAGACLLVVIQMWRSRLMEPQQRVVKCDYPEKTKMSVDVPRQTAPKQAAALLADTDMCSQGLCETDVHTGRTVPRWWQRPPGASLGDVQLADGQPTILVMISAYVRT